LEFHREFHWSFSRRIPGIPGIPGIIIKILGIGIPALIRIARSAVVSSLLTRHTFRKLIIHNNYL
jgi:hypothetical protein